ncbi:MAG: hypothetical protein AAGE94_20755 [Acidobacteriota bacterium]
MSTTHSIAGSRTTRRKARQPEILYRFPVQDARTGATYYVVVHDDGLAYREDAVTVSEPLPVAV